MIKKLRCVALSVVLLPLALLARSDFPYVIFGFFNRRFRWFDTFFFIYPANAAYARTYAPAWFEPYAKWTPCPVGIMRTRGTLGVVFGSLMTERDFLNPKNADDFNRLLRRMERVAKLAGLRSIRMAGILPSTAARRGETFFEDTSGVAAEVVLKAFLEVRARTRRDDPATVALLLGGAGLVGAQVAALMAARGIPFRVLDPKAGPVDPAVFRLNAPTVLVDVARKGVLEKYLSDLPDGTVILNETYPEPGPRVRRQLAERGAGLYHIRGVEGSVWPALPGGYTDAIPCCGAPTDGRPVEIRLS
ncbi:MAG: hypothetical protein AAF908_05230, partial [Pseudomonadota bacterium]